jgi:hypothetical protein
MPPQGVRMAPNGGPKTRTRASRGIPREEGEVVDDDGAAAISSEEDFKKAWEMSAARVPIDGSLPAAPAVSASAVASSPSRAAAIARESDVMEAADSADTRIDDAGVQ